MGRVLFAGGKPAMEAPSGGLLLSDIAVGSIVKLNESGSPVEFYVAKHDYESGLNGAGRTLLVKKALHHDYREWHGSNGNEYASCSLDNWFNGEYKSLLDEAVQSAIGETTFYYTPGNGATTVTTLTRSIFALSATELGYTGSVANTEGTALPIATTLANVQIDGHTYAQWTRSPFSSGSKYACYFGPRGIAIGSSSDLCCDRPAFTLPATALFDEETLEFKGVA